MHHQLRIICLAGATFLGCGEAPSAAPAAQVVVGIIEIGGTLEDALSGPSTAVAGEPVTFRVTTYGAGCYRPAGAAVINQTLQMTITPYDSVLPGVCTRELRALPRDVFVAFDRAGTVILRLQGQSFTGPTPVILTRTIQILP